MLGNQMYHRGAMIIASPPYVKSEATDKAYVEPSISTKVVKGTSLSLTPLLLVLDRN